MIEENLLLLGAAVLVTQAHPIYINDALASFWDECFFQNMDHSVAYTMLTLGAFVFLGITQLTWSRAVKQPQDAELDSRVRMSKGLQVITGLGFLIVAFILFVNPAFEQNSFSPPILLSLVFLLTPALAAVAFLSKNARKTSGKSNYTVNREDGTVAFGDGKEGERLLMEQTELMVPPRKMSEACGSLNARWIQSS